MSKFSLQVGIKHTNGTSGTYTTQVALPDQLDNKIGNSSFKSEVISALEVCLPQLLGGGDWRKNGGKVISFNCVTKIK